MNVFVAHSRWGGGGTASWGAGAMTHRKVSRYLSRVSGVADQNYLLHKTHQFLRRP